MFGFFSTQSSWRLSWQILNLAGTAAGLAYLLTSEDAKSSELAFKLVINLITVLGLRDNNGYLSYLSGVFSNTMGLGNDYAALTSDDYSCLPADLNALVTLIHGVNLGMIVVRVPEDAPQAQAGPK
ncbi:hypothetical protein Lbir_1592 [Legionella birminghamensis]|uniref:Uncharacterized protein n=1 Tax=Legionella birminghamensis TaxID=28083 RepID=A0A378IBZ0_9GAMM|nr:hypothetical protein [Legionella birminghamensis]KTC71737.1 hypothetical protein Lbir_1592 [Legionella birminghamensis]STX32426.1 Uncharacterised protein [Legionella birminghamensis]